MAKEKETLSRYSGFGGIKEVLNIGTDNPLPDNMAEPMQPPAERPCELSQAEKRQCIAS